MDTNHNNNGNYFLFTDGSCKNNGKSYEAGWAFIIYDSNKKIVKQENGVIRGMDANNQKAELTAILRGLRVFGMFTTISKLVIVTDSEYSIKCCTEWCKKWKDNNWKTSNGQDVKHRDIIEMIISKVESIDCSWTHINSHTNNTDWFSQCNNEVDKLASSYYKINL